MAFCPNCGSAINDGAKFCSTCGGALPAAQAQAVQAPAQPIQPQPQSQIQPVYQQPVQPQVQPQIQPVYQQPAQPQIQPVYQQPAQPQIQPQVQPAGQPATKEKANGLCTAGFVLSLLGVFLFGITSLFGLILSIAGLISANKKKQKGKGKAVAGIILALLMVLVAVACVIVLKTSNPVTDFIGSTFGVDLNYKAPEYEEFATDDGWVLITDETYIEFNAQKNTVKYCMSYLEMDDNYLTGHYEMYTGKKAVNYLTKKLGDSGITEEQLDDIIDDNEKFYEANLIAITCDYDELVFEGEVQEDFEPITSHLFGFYTIINQGEYVFDAIEIFNIETQAGYVLIKESQFRDYIPGYSESTDITEPSDEVTETDDPYYETEQTYDIEQTENTTSDDENIVGDSITGTVTLTQGTWEIWQEADGGLNDSIRSRHQRINIDTETIFNLTTFDFMVDPASVADLAESTKQDLESEGTYIKAYGETTIGGYKAYIVTGQYQDGMNLSVWLFTDSNGYLHYISVEYYDYDYASYEMVRDTYTLE